MLKFQFGYENSTPIGNPVHNASRVSRVRERDTPPNPKKKKVYLKAMAISLPNFSRALSIIFKGEAFVSSFANFS